MKGRRHRASTDPEPSGIEVLLMICILFAVIATGAHLLLEWLPSLLRSILLLPTRY